MTPSQLSSMPLQVSTTGMPVALQTRRPIWQTNMPEPQVPSPVPQRSPTPGSVPSSIMPSQSSSSPLHTSVCGGTVGASQNVPLWSGRHARMPPRAQMPTPLFMHDAPTMKPSSMSPSQSLSRPSQRSGGRAQPQGWPQALGGKPSSTVPSQSSSMQLHASTAQWRAAVPSRLSGSLGLLGMATVHMFDTPSSISPLQLSSTPLQTSLF